jgi:hypothetical protein
VQHPMRRDEQQKPAGLIIVNSNMYLISHTDTASKSSWLYVFVLGMLFCAVNFISWVQTDAIIVFLHSYMQSVSFKH